ncbi:hypothetical protein EG68_07426, partial [Paragonimus skrjabini miyazakii]
TAVYSVRTDPVAHRHSRRLPQPGSHRPHSPNATRLETEFNADTRFRYYRRSFPKTKHYLIEEPLPALPMENTNRPPEGGQYNFIRPHSQQRQTSSRFTECESYTFSPKFCTGRDEFDFQTAKQPVFVSFVPSHCSPFEDNHHQFRQSTISRTPLVECRDKSFTMPLLDTRPSSRQQVRLHESSDFDNGPRYYDYLADQSPDVHIQQTDAAPVRKSESTSSLLIPRSSTVSVLDETPERILRPPTRLQRRSSDLSSFLHSGNNDAVATANDQTSSNWHASYCARIHSQLSTDVESQPPSLLRSSTTQDSELVFANKKSISDFLEGFHLPPSPVCSPNSIDPNGYQLINSGDRYPEANLPSPPSVSFLKHLQTQSPADLHSKQRTFNGQYGNYVQQQATNDTGLVSRDNSQQNQSIRVRQLPLTPPERVTQNQQKLHQQKASCAPDAMCEMNLGPRFSQHTVATERSVTHCEFKFLNELRHSCSTSEVLLAKAKDPGAHQRSEITSQHFDGGSHFDEVFEPQSEIEDLI